MITFCKFTTLGINLSQPTLGLSCRGDVSFSCDVYTTLDDVYRQQLESQIPAKFRPDLCQVGQIWDY